MLRNGREWLGIVDWRPGKEWASGIKSNSPKQCPLREYSSIVPVDFELGEGGKESQDIGWLDCKNEGVLASIPASVVWSLLWTVHDLEDGRALSNCVLELCCVYRRSTKGFHVPARSFDGQIAFCIPFFTPNGSRLQLLASTRTMIHASQPHAIDHTTAFSRVLTSSYHHGQPLPHDYTLTMRFLTPARRSDLARMDVVRQAMVGYDRVEKTRWN
ncbi:hypothetical protein BJ508DRAFT_95310 [Ascobolus immersus RN42]|uniref:Uncharacterized protein n=1 Tax=Ascobolus immersus RN42 TaxID=1160509 RepID=A0A3N4IQM2_ASCIM|nr:hypothetical protein BJ508DRAFT_95310 [Ascobolus immersus RN42]